MGVEISIFTSLNISKNKPQSNAGFSGRIELVEDFFKFEFLIDNFVSNMDIWMLNTLCLPFSTSVSSRKC